MTYKTPLTQAIAALMTAAIVVLGGASTALAANFTGTGSITILESLAVSEESGVDFGYIHRPSSGTNTFMLSYSDNSVTTEGTGDAQLVEGTSTSGLYLISGAPEQAIQVSVSIVDFTDPGISIVEAHVNGLSDTANGQLDESGVYAAQVGGVVSISSDAGLGTHTTDIIVTAAYE